MTPILETLIVWYIININLVLTFSGGDDITVSLSYNIVYCYEFGDNYWIQLNMAYIDLKE